MSDQDSIVIGFMAIIGGIIGIGFSAWIAYSLHDGLLRIPKQYRTTEPYFAWLTLVPLAGIVFYWILLPFKIPESLKNYFSENSVNQEMPTDFGKSMGLGTVISATLMIVPFINFIAWIPTIVFFILFMLQFKKMVKQLPQRIATISANTDKFAQLEKLKKLLDDGVLTEDEYKIEKQKLL